MAKSRADEFIEGYLDEAERRRIKNPDSPEADAEMGRMLRELIGAQLEAMRPYLDKFFEADLPPMEYGIRIPEGGITVPSDDLERTKARLEEYREDIPESVLVGRTQVGPWQEMEA